MTQTSHDATTQIELPLLQVLQLGLTYCIDSFSDSAMGTMPGFTMSCQESHLVCLIAADFSDHLQLLQGLGAKQH